MPELAEVEYYRKQWDCGLGAAIRAVALHPGKRIFRGANVEALQELLPGSKLRASEARGKQMLFRFSKGFWLGVHLGMTGKLCAEKPDFAPGKHDHLVLFQNKRALVFADTRQFGRVQFHQGVEPPDWWTNLPPDLTSPEFTVAVMEQFLQRHRQLPIKATLLLQKGFLGIGNWMADEILWRVRMHPRTRAGEIKGRTSQALWQSVRFVCRAAVKHIGKDFSDPPRGWLIHERWHSGGKCPRDGETLVRETIGGRTTAWCSRCQPKRKS